MGEGKLSIKLLQDDNYNSWKSEIEDLLRKERLWTYINEYQPRSLADKEASIRKIRDDMAKKILLTHIGNADVISNIINCSTAREMWLKLVKIYNLKGQAYKGILLENLITFPAMREEDDVCKAVTNFFKIFDKLKNLDRQMNNNLFCVILLNKLPPSFKHFGISTQYRDIFPTMKDLVEEISAKWRANSQAKYLYNMNASYEMATKQSGKKRPMCALCGEAHNTETCVKRIFTDKAGASGTVKKKIKCSICKEEGHNTETCVKRIFTDKAGASGTVKKKIKCSICKEEGHNKTNCEQDVIFLY